MKLRIQSVTPEILKQAEEYFDEKYKNIIKQKSSHKESLIARYLIHHYTGKYSSISHKKNLVFIGVNDRNIGIDIEIFKQRDISLLQKFSQEEYNILGDYDWNNFYTLWVTKESMIKFVKGKLDDMEDIKIIEASHISKEISDILFNRKLIGEFQGKLYTIYSGKKGNMFYSVCID